MLGEDDLVLELQCTSSHELVMRDSVAFQLLSSELYALDIGIGRFGSSFDDQSLSAIDLRIELYGDAVKGR